MILAAFTLALTLGAAQDETIAGCVSVAQVAQAAAVHDPRIAGAQAALLASEAGFTEALSLSRPQVSAFARSSVGDGGLTSNQIDNQVGLRVSQRLLDFGDSRLARSGARSRVRASEYSIQTQQILSAAEAAQSHLDYILSVENRVVIEMQIAELSGLLERLERLLASGAATRDSVAAVRSRLAAAQAEAAQLELAAIEAQSSIALLTGARPVLCEVASEAEMLSIVTIDEIGEGPMISPQIESLRNEVSAAQAEASRARRDRLPTVDLVAIGSYAYDDFRDEWAYRDQVGVDISVPIYQGDLLRARVSRADADVASRTSELNRARRRLTEETRAASSRIRALRLLRDRREEAARTKADELDALEVAFQGGQRTLFQLLETQTALADAQQALARVRYQLFVEYLTLGALTGRLNVSLEPIDGAQRSRIWGWEPDPAE